MACFLVLPTRRKITVASLFIMGALYFLTIFPPELARAATGDTAPQPPGEVATGVNLALVLLGMATPLVTYVLNHYAPWASEQAKALVQALVAAAAGAVYQMLSDGNFGWNTQTLLAVLTVMASALASHLGYKVGGINTLLGGGVNHNRGGPDEPSEVRPGLSR